MDAKLDFDASYVYQDVNQAIQHVHRSSLLHRSIISDPQKYLMKNVSNLDLSLLLKKKKNLISGETFSYWTSLYAFIVFNSWIALHFFCTVRFLSHAYKLRCFLFFPFCLQSKVLKFLKMLKENGKKVFLLTNSPYYFVDGGMHFLLEVLPRFLSFLHKSFTC